MEGPPRSQRNMKRIDMKPQVLQLNPILIPAINDALAERYVVHKYFEMAQPQEWLRDRAPISRQ